jgi:hypothetical protein
MFSNNFNIYSLVEAVLRLSFFSFEQLGELELDLE